MAKAIPARVLAALGARSSARASSGSVSQATCDLIPATSPARTPAIRDSSRSRPAARSISGYADSAPATTLSIAMAAASEPARLSTPFARRMKTG